MKKRNKGLLSVFLTALLLLTACSPGGDTGGTAGGFKDTLVVASAADAVTFDIHNTNDSATTRVARQIYETLIRQTEDLELVPSLAESWEAIDDTTYEFKLKKGVTFHNGEPFTAKDVAYTLKRALTSANVGHIVGEIDETKITVVDDHTIRIGTKKPFGPLLTHLAHPATAIMNEKAVTEGGDDYSIAPVGTGPYKLTNWTAGSEINLERYEGYHGTAGATEKITFKVIKEDSVRVIALENGEIDVAYDIPPNEIATVEASEGLTLVRDLNLSTAYVGINTQSKTPLSDVKVRQAINYAIDVETIVANVFQGVGKPAKGPLNPLVFGSTTGLPEYGYDVEKAKALLAEAGYPNGGFGFNLYVGDNNAQRIKIAEIIKEALAQLNIEVTITQLEWASFLEATGKGEADMFILGWTTVTTDADYGLYPLFHSSQQGAAGNRSFYVNARVDELLEAGKTETDTDKRLALYKEAQEIIAEEVPWVFVQDGENVTGISNKVKGFKHHPTATYFLEKVTVEK